jgi:hypothetical protein
VLNIEVRIAVVEGKSTGQARFNVSHPEGKASWSVWLPMGLDEVVRRIESVMVEGVERIK